MYIALCLIVNIKCIVCFCKGGGSLLILNQAGGAGLGGGGNPTL